MQSRKDDTNNFTAASFADSHQIFLVGLKNCGQEKLKRDLQDAVIISNSSTEAQALKTKKDKTIRVVEFADDMVDDTIAQVIFLELQRYETSVPSLVVFCLDSGKSVNLQRAMIETAVILLNNRNFSGNYEFIQDINHGDVRADVHNKALESLMDLEHANFLSGNKIFVDGEYDGYSQKFTDLNTRINRLISTLLKDETYAKISHYLGPVDTAPAFKKFIELYDRDYENSGIFKRSHFKDAVDKKEITTMEHIKAYAEKHPASRTSFLLKCHPEHCVDIKFLRFVNRYEHAYLTPGFFKSSKFRGAVATGKIASIQQVEDHAKSHPGSRTASVLQTFNKR